MMQLDNLDLPNIIVFVIVTKKSDEVVNSLSQPNVKLF